ncbi:MAG: hypothetical protein ACXW1Q_09005 [Halobacteriota archaeon]
MTKGFTNPIDEAIRTHRRFKPVRLSDQRRASERAGRVSGGGNRSGIVDIRAGGDVSKKVV